MEENTEKLTSKRLHRKVFEIVAKKKKLTKKLRKVDLKESNQIKEGRQSRKRFVRRGINNNSSAFFRFVWSFAIRRQQELLKQRLVLITDLRLRLIIVGEVVSVLEHDTFSFPLFSPFF